MRPIENEKPIVFVECDEDRVVIEKKDYGMSLFSSQYTTAFGILKRLIEIPNGDTFFPGQGNSRIIAFCGDRGAGKTSCMMSVRYAIEHNEDEGIKEYLESNGLKTDELNVDMLNPIDPSYFDESHNILELVLGQMYLHFKIRAKELKDADTLDTEALEEVKDRFDDVKRSLSLISDSPQRMFDKLEELENLSVAMSLYERLKELFDAYLAFMGKKRILITIDDMDFNAEGAYRMCKFLQMYLNQPTCIVLISLKISQLVSILGDDRNFKDTKDEDRRSEMSSKYVQKLIPISNRVQMVDIWSISERQFVIDRNGETTKPERIKDGVVRLIFQKTRYLFYNTKGEVSPIIPHSLRSFRQLLSLLCRMENYDKSSKEVAVQARNEGNKFQFKSYFYTEWIRTLSKEDRAFAEELSALEDTKSFNKKIVSYLAKVANLKETSYDFGSITNPQNYTYNISTGDVLSIIRYLERSTESTGLKDLLFFIKSCYSIRLYESYDEMTDAKDLTFDEVSDGEVFKSDTWFRRTSKLQSLVNGNYFRYDAGSYVTDKDEKNAISYYYDKVLLDSKLYSLLFDLAERLEKAGEELDDKLKKEFLLAEFLIMCTSHNHYGKYETKPDVNRRDSLPYYLEPIAWQTEYVVFDINSIFSNMINIKYSYDRYSQIYDFYGFSDKHDWTLLGRLRKDITTVRELKEYKTVDHAIASDAIIRNVDVLMSLTEMMESNAIRQTDKNESVVKKYTTYLEGLHDIGMKTYRVDDDGKPYELRFSFIKTFCSILSELDAVMLAEILHSANDINKASKTTVVGGKAQ